MMTNVNPSLFNVKNMQQSKSNITASVLDKTQLNIKKEERKEGRKEWTLESLSA